MSIFIRRPVATTLLTLALALGGLIGFGLLPVSPIPQVEFPTIQVSATLPGASPETMASAVAMPLERQFGRIAGVTDMTSTSALGSTAIVLQFDLARNIDAAARDVQAAINAARSQLPTNLPSNPQYRKVNPADAPILIFALTSDTLDISRVYDAASSILQQKLAQVDGVGQVFVGGGAPVRLSDVADVQDSVEDLRTTGIANGKPGVLIILFRQPAANIISTVDRVRALVPQLRAAIPAAIDVSVMIDRSVTIRASIADVERTLIAAIALVVLVVSARLRNGW